MKKIKIENEEFTNPKYAKQMRNAKDEEEMADILHHWLGRQIGLDQYKEDDIVFCCERFIGYIREINIEERGAMVFVDLGEKRNKIGFGLVFLGASAKLYYKGGKRRKLVGADLFVFEDELHPVEISNRLFLQNGFTLCKHNDEIEKLKREWDDVNRSLTFYKNKKEKSIVKIEYFDGLVFRTLFYNKEKPLRYIHELEHIFQRHNIDNPFSVIVIGQLMKN